MSEHQAKKRKLRDAAIQPNGGPPPGRPGFEVGWGMGEDGPVALVRDPLAGVQVTMPAIHALRVAALLTSGYADLLDMARQKAIEAARGPGLLLPAPTPAERGNQA